MQEKTEKLIILGQTGSGKDFLRRKLAEKLRYSPKFTTRPMRKHEKDGVDYNFITEVAFQELKNSDSIKVYQSFQIGESVWTYGITKQNFEDNQLFIFTPHEFAQLDSGELKGCFVVYLDIDLETRRKRLIKRNDNNDSIERRLSSDAEDFKDFDYYDLKITDPEFEAEAIYDLMF